MLSACEGHDVQQFYGFFLNLNYRPSWARSMFDNITHVSVIHVSFDSWYIFFVNTSYKDWLDSSLINIIQLFN